METDSKFLDDSMATPWTLAMGRLLPLLAMAAILGLFFLLAITIRSRSRKIHGIPFVGVEYGGVEKRKQKFFHEAGSLLQQGYDQFPHGLFQVSTEEGPTVIVSRQFVEELKNEPDDVVSFSARGEKTMMPKYTGCSSENDLGVHVVKSDLTANLNPVTLITNDEVEHALTTELKVSNDWIQVNIFSKMLRIVSTVSGRVFCEDLCRDEEWINITINYTMDVFTGALALKKWYPWIRPLVYRFVPQIKSAHKGKKRAVELLRPVLEARVRGDPEKKDAHCKPMDMLQWLCEKSISDGKVDVDHITGLQLILGFASIHSNTGTITNMLYDLVARPEYIEPLQEEIRTALDKNDGIHSRRALDQMWKLDSFMKESMRYTPTNLTMFKRTILKDVKLSDGTDLPAGTLIEVPAGPMARDEAIVPGGNPNEFDGFRYYRLRQEASREDSAKHLFATVSIDGGMHFGYGRRACPGRFFTTNLIKLVLAHLLLEYDFKMPEKDLRRYENLRSEATNFVDPSKNLLFRKIVIQREEATSAR